MGYLSQIAAGSFVSDGNPRVLQFDGSADIVRLYYQGNASGDVWVANGATPALKELYWNRNMGADKGLGTQNVASNTEDEKVFISSGGVSPFAPSYGALAAPKTITSVSQANPARVTATAHGYQTGDIVVIQGVAGMAQINGIAFQVIRIDANNFDLNGLNSSGFAAAGTGGVARRVLYPYIWMPVALTPIAITQAANAVVTTSFDHRYLAGQFVSLSVPAGWGMVQADQKVALIKSVTANTLTIDLDTSGFTAFAFPASGAPLPVPSVTNYASSGSQVLNPYRNDGLKGVYLGTSVAGSNGALVHFEILQSDFFQAV